MIRVKLANQKKPLQDRLLVLLVTSERDLQLTVLLLVKFFIVTLVHFTITMTIISLAETWKSINLNMKLNRKNSAIQSKIKEKQDSDILFW